MRTKNVQKLIANSHSTEVETAPEGGYAPEADFEDSIAKNRAVPIIDAAKVPRPPADYRPTDPDTRNKRLRKLAGEHGAETLAALNNVANRDLKADFGKHAPDPKRSIALAERLNKTSALLTAARALYFHARELNQIARSDALVYLEKVNKMLVSTVDDHPALADDYESLRALFEARGEAIAEGRAQGPKAKEKAKAKPAAEEANDA